MIEMALLFHGKSLADRLPASDKNIYIPDDATKEKDPNSNKGQKSIVSSQPVLFASFGGYLRMHLS